MYKRLTQSQKNFPYVAIHYRQGVGNFAIYPGQSISREIDLQYFKNILQQYFAEKSELKQVVHIFTDSPNSIIYYNPPQDQLYLWEGSPGFKDGTLEIKPLIFTAELLGVDEVVVHSGGDPLEAIEKMAQATLLVTGRSSLSYVAGLMNASGSVYAAPAFWHPKLPQWREGIFNV
jgi:hypothetical protein